MCKGLYGTALLAHTLVINMFLTHIQVYTHVYYKMCMFKNTRVDNSTINDIDIFLSIPALYSIISILNTSLR